MPLSHSFLLVTAAAALLATPIDGFSGQTFSVDGRRQSSGSSSSNHILKAERSAKGFGATKSEIPTKTDKEKNSNGGEIYSLPSLYDMAFGYRNFEEEVDFLMDQHRKLDPDEAPPKRVLELAAGPARHCIEALAASYIESATAIDNSAEMIEYAREIASEELKSDDYTFEEISGNDVMMDSAYEHRVNSLKYIQADMTNFSIPSLVDTNENEATALFDSAWILLGSLQHLTTNEEVISCFKCIHKVLRSKGTFILELPHPRETFSMVECTRNGWEVPLDDENGKNCGELKIVWGDDNDEFDPITQVRQFTVSMELTGEDPKEKPLQSVREIVPMRHFTAQEIDMLARIAGFELKTLHGALQFDVDVNDDEQAFRLVCVLQKQ
jgi:SAM-dependent methyltransferase